MAMVTTITSNSCNISGNLENRNSLREPSFSSYLDSAEESFVHQLAKSSRNLDSFPSIPHDPLHLGRKKTEYEEIDVFSAEKYFKGEVVHNSSPILQNNNDDPLDVESLKQKTRPGTPSVRSESSQNSRSSLLQIPRNQQPRKANNTRRKSFLASLGCNCSCIDKDSVKVDKQINEAKSKELHSSHFKKSHSTTWLNEDRRCKMFDETRGVMSPRDDISLPAFSPLTGNAKKLHSQQEEGDIRRKSVEVFGSPVHAIRDKSLSADNNQIKMFAWDAIPRKEIELDIPETPNEKYEDTGSDASSDLFEIESFSTNTNPYLTRQASDGTCYAPSEASIEWSTVTASAADFSVMSDYEELSTTTDKTSLHRKVLDRKNMNGKEMPKRRPSILSGCKSHRDVSVARDAYRVSEKPCPDLQRHQRFESLKPTSRFHTTRNGHHRFEALPLAESQFKRAPHLLYMH